MFESATSEIIDVRANGFRINDSRAAVPVIITLLQLELLSISYAQIFWRVSDWSYILFYKMQTL